MPSVFIKVNLTLKTYFNSGKSRSCVTSPLEKKLNHFQLIISHSRSFKWKDLCFRCHGHFNEMEVFIVHGLHCGQEFDMFMEF